MQLLKKNKNRLQKTGSYGFVLANSLIMHNLDKQL